MYFISAERKLPSPGRLRIPGNPGQSEHAESEVPHHFVSHIAQNVGLAQTQRTGRREPTAQKSTPSPPSKFALPPPQHALPSPEERTSSSQPGSSRLATRGVGAGESPRLSRLERTRGSFSADWEPSLRGGYLSPEPPKLLGRADFQGPTIPPREKGRPRAAGKRAWCM